MDTEHIQAHFRTHVGQLLRQEVRRIYPFFERSEGMLRN